jgi:hypothetical protein
MLAGPLLVGASLSLSVRLTGLADGLALKELRYAQGDSPHLLGPPLLAYSRELSGLAHPNKLVGHDFRARRKWPVFAGFCCSSASRRRMDCSSQRSAWASCARPGPGEPRSPQRGGLPRWTGPSENARKASQGAPSVERVPCNPQTGQASWAPSRPDQTEPTDLRDVFTSWLPSTGSDGAIETLDRLPGLARANEVWEQDFNGPEQPDPEFGERGLFQIHTPASLSGLEADEPQWRGPDQIGLALQRQFD